MIATINMKPIILFTDRHMNTNKITIFNVLHYVVLETAQSVSSNFVFAFDLNNGRKE